LALAEGGYAVEVERHGRRELVGVETGLFADGQVEVEGGGLRAGDRVVVPLGNPPSSFARWSSATPGHPRWRSCAG
ncbi:MAG TPA: hypothetical protein VG499_14880, partial [Actinomycetota bacterium]|nr:hypothetical protein [Actinomycetota bacterium]